MFPVGLLISSIINHFVGLGVDEKHFTEAEFRSRINIFIYCKTGLALLCCGLCFLVEKPPSGTQAERQMEETKAYGLCSQLKILMSNGVYLAFVFGPMLSICLLAATDNNLSVLLAPFKIQPVSLTKK